MQDHLGIQVDLSRDEQMSDFALALLRDYYMRDDETSPQQAYARAAVAYCAGDMAFAQRIYDYVSRGWFMFASPVLSNAPNPGGKWKALPISCFLTYVPDTLEGLIGHSAELRWLSVKGGGVGGHWSQVRSVSGKSPGPIPFLKTVDADMTAYRQGTTRKGSYAAYLDVSHPDVLEFLQMRLPTGGDPNRKCLNLHNAINITDDFMRACIAGDEWDLLDPHDGSVRDTLPARQLFQRILEVRSRTGEPYLNFIDTANRAMPNALKSKGLRLNGSNLCVTGDQRVVTNRGMLTAKELYEEGGALTVFDNTKVQAASPMSLIEKDAPVFNIVLQNGLTHRVTGYHKVKTERGDVACCDLTPGDRVFVQTKKGLFGSLDMEDEAFLLGMYQADGTQEPARQMHMLDVWENDFDLLDEIQERFSRIHVKYGCDTYEVAPGITRGREPATFHEQNTGHSDVRKMRLATRTFYKANLGFVKGQIPNWIWRASEATQWQYVRGLFIADGTVGLGKGHGQPVYLSITNVDRPFLCDLMLLLRNLGINASLRKHEDAGPKMLPDGKGGMKQYRTKKAWRLVISNKPDALVFEENTGFLSRKGVLVEKRAYRDNTRKVFEVEKVVPAGTEDVYCLTVASDEHHFICNGIVTRNCNEIHLPTDPERTAVCCVSSLNVAKYDEWEDDPRVVPDLIRMLDNVLQVFVDEAPTELDRARYSAQQERSLGLGAMGFHDYLQSKGIAWESPMAVGQNRRIFQQIHEQAVEATKALARERGEYRDGKGTGRRNAHLIAIAPNANSSVLLGTSPSIEPWKSNAYTHRTRAGSFQVRNPALVTLLEKRVPDPVEREAIWSGITTNNGSVQHLPDPLLADYEKRVFLTAFELDQRWVVQHAADRQPFVCQGQSVNLFFPAGSDKNYVLQTHIKAWKDGLKGLYYLRTSAGVDPDKVSHKVERVALRDFVEQEECIACQG